MAQSESIAALAAALCEAQYALETAQKDSVNPHFKSRYADLASVWSAARPALHAHGLSVVQAPEPCDSGIQLRTILLHKSGEWIDSVLTLPASKQDPQGYGSAMTYARRYALAAMVGIVADDDDDGNAASGISGKRTESQQRPAQQNGTTYTDTANAADQVINFGKYKGQTFGDVAAKDRAYIEWLAENARYLDDREMAAAVLAGPEAF